MDSMPLSALILQTLPEEIIILMVGYALSGMDFAKDFRRILTAGIFSGLASFLIRSLPIPFGLHTLLTVPVLVIFIKYFLRLSYKNSFIVFLLGLLSLFIVEMIYVPFVAAVLNIPISSLITDPLLRIVIPWTYQVIMVLMCFYFRAKKITVFPLFNLIGSKFFNTKYSLIFLVFVQAVLLGIINASLLLQQNNGYKLTTEVTVNVHILSTVILFSLALSLFLVRKLLTSVKKEIEAESQLLFLRNVNDLFISLRAQRHDFINHVHTLNGLLAIDNFDLAKEYARKLSQDTVQLNDVLRVKEPFLAALLRSKLAVADNKGIEFHIICETPLDRLNIDSFDLTKIIGNLIDNSFDAVEKAPTGNRRVEISIKKYTGHAIFEIANFGPEIPEEVLKQIFNPEFTTKEGHSGLGLTIVKQLVEKYKGSIGAKSLQGETVFTIMLPEN